MRSALVYIVLLLVVITTCTYVPPEEDKSCDCNSCDKENNKEESGDTTTIHPKDVEDGDGDGDRTICARDRDFDDRTFASVCHMLCYNRCTRLRYLIDENENAKLYTVNGYRTNYYKLRDGKC